MVLLEQPERQPQEGDLQGGEEEEELATVLSHKFLIQSVLFGRRMDSSPTVQGHALACLAQCLELPSLNATQAVHHLFSASEEIIVLFSCACLQQRCVDFTFKLVLLHQLEPRRCWRWS